jgi:DNA-binding MarR family transcriptional regulator
MLARMTQQRSQPDRDCADATEALYLLMISIVRRFPRDMSLTQLSTLSTLADTGPRRVTDLASLQGVTQPSMTELITNLERAGYVTRLGDPRDGRVSLVALTDGGLGYVRARHEGGAEELRQLAGKLSDEERGALIAAAPVLNRLRELDSGGRDPHPADQP